MMKIFEFKKLIRNKLPAKMAEEGVVVHSKILNKQEFCLQLKNKLLEEVEEVLEADEVDDITIELADVLEVLHSIAKIYHIPFVDIENTRLEKQNINGYFDQKTYIDYIEVEDSNHKVINYLLNKKRPYRL